MVMNKFRRVSTHAANLERSQTVTESQNGVIELKKENQKLAEKVGVMITQMSRAIYPDKREVENWLTMNTKIKQLQSETADFASCCICRNETAARKCFLKQIRLQTRWARVPLARRPTRSTPPHRATKQPSSSILNMTTNPTSTSPQSKHLQRATPGESFQTLMSSSRNRMTLKLVPSRHVRLS